MIKLKLNFGEGKDNRDIDIVDGEFLSDAVKRAVQEVPLEDKKESDIFHVVVNGNFIEPDFWNITKLKTEDVVLISPSMQSGETGQIFKQIAIIVVVAVASVYLGPAVGGGLAGALAVGAVTLGATLALNALIPPPVPDEPGAGPGTVESSQMYNISGQSNAVKRYDTVPKVYGTHRIFPNVVGLPYTELATDPRTGELIQYLYCIYDFGFGPAYVTNLAIGDTPLNADNFSDYQINFVDLKKPDVSEGVWDDVLKKDFTLYRGDSEGDNVSSDINGNQDAGDPQQEWQLVRNTAPNNDGLDQEIILNFAAPKGLYYIKPNGEQIAQRIELNIEFSRVGEDNWKKYNDPTWVKTWDSVGTAPAPMGVVYPSNPNLGDLYDPYIIGFEGNRGEGSAIYKDLPANMRNGYFREIHFRPGSNVIILNKDSESLVLDAIFYGDQYLGYGPILDIQTYPQDSNYWVIPLYKGSSPTVIPPGLIAFLYYRDEVNGQWILVDRVADKIFKVAKFPGQGVAYIERNDVASVYATFRFTPREVGQFKIRVTRLSTYTPNYSLPGSKPIREEKDLTWINITTRISRPPIVTDKRHVYMEIKIRATGQLNGNIQNLSGIVNSVHEVYDSDTETWSRQFTNNPAWIFTGMMIGEENKRAIDKSRLHLDSIVEWAEFCDEIPDPPPDKTYVDKRFTCNFILDYRTGLQALLNQVANGAQASLNIIDGKYGVLVDRRRNTPVQIFTQRNSKDFSSQRNYARRPKGVSVKYIDPSRNWEAQEVVVYDDGFDEFNVNDDEIDDLTSFACTSQEQAWRFGRYMIAQNKLRQETMSITVDFEHLVCTRGDFVQITQDVMRAGGHPARVKTVAGNVITINDGLDIDPDLDYGYVFRSNNGTITKSTLTPTGPRTFTVDGAVPAVGNMIVIGEVDRIVYDCIVRSIAPNDDLSAQLVLVEKADAIYDYESSGSLPDYDPEFSQATNPDIAPPKAVTDLTVADVAYDCAPTGQGYFYYVDLTWNNPPKSIYEYFAIFVNNGRGYLEVGQSSSALYRYIVDPKYLGVEHSFKVIAVSATGRKLPIGSVDAVAATPIAKTTPPSNVEKLTTDITNEVLQLSWPLIEDCDAAKYLLRYTPALNGVWESSIPLVEVNNRVSSVSVQARAGTYLIKVIDFAGNESIIAAAAITTIPGLVNLNVIDEFTDSPNFDGSFEQVEKLGDSIILQKDTATDTFYSEGYYYYQELLDLGEIYTVRLQSLIQAEGYSAQDIIANWTTLDSVLLLSNAKYSEWSIETQYRSTEEFNVMADWDTLEDIGALNEGNVSNFTEWRTFSMGDATGRVFQFRLKLISNKATVTPRVFDATIRADMPDRIESFENVIATADDGYEVNYAPAFKGPGSTPNVQVSIDGAQSGDYWSFDYKTLEGFLIRVYDKNGNPVTRQLDIVIKGYGRQYTSAI